MTSEEISLITTTLAALVMFWLERAKRKKCGCGATKKKGVPDVPPPSDCDH